MEVPCFQKVLVVSSIFFLPHSSFFWRTFLFALQYHIACHLLFLITSSLALSLYVNGKFDDDDVQFIERRTHTWIGDKWDCYYNEVISFLDIFLSIGNAIPLCDIIYTFYTLQACGIKIDKQTMFNVCVCVYLCRWMKVVKKRKIKNKKEDTYSCTNITHFLHQFRCIFVCVVDILHAMP